MRMVGVRQNRSILLPFLLGAALCTCGCDVEKMANRFTGPDSLSGRNAAKGGLGYTPQSSGKEWSHTVFTCRGSISEAGVTTIRAGKSGGDLPLTVIADKTGVRSLKADTPDGSVSFDHASCSILDLKMNLPAGASGAPPEITGKVTFKCAKDGGTLEGSVDFNQCGN